jgi:hypothetical protein
MIQMPKRSVTRFFIPLIDVMILLFCVFLLMPIFDEARKDEDENQPASASVALRRSLDIARLSKQVRTAKEEIDRLRQEQDPVTRKERDELNRLRKEKGKPLQDRFAVFVLNIDGTTGKLFYYEPDAADAKIVLDSKEDAERLIARQQQEAAGRETYFLFREPREESRFPTTVEIKKFKGWFGNVRYGFDSPPRVP